MRNKNVQIMVETAVLVGAALLLSELRLWRAAQGGSITLEMLPIFVLAFRRGGVAGLMGGGLFGVLQIILGGYIYHPVQVILDYPAAFLVLGVAGFGLQRQVRWLGVITEIGRASRRDRLGHGGAAAPGGTRKEGRMGI